MERERLEVRQPLVDIRIEVRDLILDYRTVKHFLKVVAKYRPRLFVWPVKHKHRLLKRSAFLREVENLRDKRAAVLSGLVEIEPHPALGGEHVFLKRRDFFRRGLAERVAQIEPLYLLKRHVGDISLSVRHRSAQTT